MRSWASDLTFLSLSFFISKMGVITISSSWIPWQLSLWIPGKFLFGSDKIVWEKGEWMGPWGRRAWDLETRSLLQRSTNHCQCQRALEARAASPMWLCHVFYVAVWGGLSADHSLTMVHPVLPSHPLHVASFLFRWLRTLSANSSFLSMTHTQQLQGKWSIDTWSRATTHLTLPTIEEVLVAFSLKIRSVLAKPR